tara:strand:- start:192 stop:1001 length:810 start_codon:yes stop_codon:yes gene_type:complete
VSAKMNRFRIDRNGLSRVAIVQARMSSTRFPGKVLEKVASRPLLSFQLERIAQSQEIDDIVVATTNSKADDIIERLLVTEKVKIFRGSENDVLDRFNSAAKKFNADIIVRLTADCPLIDPDIIDKVIQKFYNQPNGCQFATNAIPRSYPAGLEVECFTRKALCFAATEATEEYDREHVTSFFYRNPIRFNPLSIVSKRDYSSERWTLDEPQDYKLIKEIIEGLYDKNKRFRMSDIIDILDENPHWRDINRMVLETPRLVSNTTFKGNGT